MAQERLDYLDIAKGIGILWVVVYHAMYFLIPYVSGYELVYYYYSKLIWFTFPFAMPLFFTVSGYLSRNVVNGDWKSLLNKRILPLCYLFGLWSFVRWVYYGFVQKNVRNLEEGGDLIELVTMWYEPVGALWFVWALAIFLIITKLVKDMPAILVLSVSLILSFSGFAELITFENFAQRNLLWYAPFVLLGYYCKDQYLSFVTRYSIPVLIGNFIIFTALYFIHDDFEGLLFGIIRFLMSFTGVVIVIALSVLLEKNDLLNKGFSYFGRETLPIYVVHSLFISAFAAIFANLYLSGVTEVRYVAVPVVGFGALAMTLLIKLIADKTGQAWPYQMPECLKIKS